MRNGRNFARKLMLLGASVMSLAAPVQNAFAEGQLDGRLIGDWLKVNSGDQISINHVGDIQISLAGQASPFSGNGAVERCITGGANLCISAARAKCAYRSTLAAGVLNLQFRSGSPDIACRALAGDYQRQDH